jgi:flagellar basal body-associated protein FliL
MGEETHSARRTDRTIIRIIIAIVLVAVLNAAISVALATSIQTRFDDAQQQQQQQGQIVFKNLCNTLDSLHADQPPSGPAADNPSRAYLQDLHTRLGELATDLKC